MAGAGPHPAHLADHHCDRLVGHLDLKHSFFLGLNQSATRIGKGFGVGLNLFDHQAAQSHRAGQNVFQSLAFFTQPGQLLFDLDGFEPRQLAQADVQNVFGLALGQAKSRHECGLGLIRLANDGDYLVNVEQHQLPPLQDVNTVQHLAEPMAGTPLDGALAEFDPLQQHLAQGLLAWPPIQPDHGQVDG